MNYEIHDLANIVAMASEREQMALTHDMKVNGQEQPAVLWQGKIIDGRCRQLACAVLDVELVTRELDDSLSEEDVVKVVKSLNIRRNLTETQKLASAYYEQQRLGTTNNQVALGWAISVRSLQNFKYIAQHRPELVDPLFNGSSVAIMDPDKGFKVTTSKVNMLARIVKQGVELRTVQTVTPREMEKFDYTVFGPILTEKGKAEYKEMMALFKTSPRKEEMHSAAMIELMNFKYQAS
jgi:hypothetical protein